jgi:hypothetical protein
MSGQAMSVEASVVDSSPRIYKTETGQYVSTPYVYVSLARQTAANMVYQQKTQADAAAVAAGKNTVYTFKTDAERMQYKIGQLALATVFR